MTTWLGESTGGRDRGPRALARAWLEVCVRPGRFFRSGVAPGDQAPGLTFLLVVVACVEGTRYALVPGAYPDLPVAWPLEAALFLGLVTLLVAPLALHAVAAVTVLTSMVAIPDRAGVSQTVQVLAYSTAPCVAAGVPVPAVRLFCAVYGAVLLVAGLRVVHATTTVRAVIAGAVPATLVFGYGFRGFSALADLGGPAF